MRISGGEIFGNVVSSNVIFQITPATTTLKVFGFYLFIL